MDKNAYDILLVDDDRDDLDSLSLVLKELSVKFSSFTRCVDLMEYLQENGMEHPPGLIILDFNMPTKNGEECLEDIRDNQQLREIPVLIYSGYVTSRKAETLQKKGANHYLKKPANIEVLRSIFRRILKLMKTNSLGSLGYVINS